MALSVEGGGGGGLNLGSGPGGAAANTDATNSAVRIAASIKKLIEEATSVHAKEFAASPYNGGFVVMHKSMFDSASAFMNAHVYGTATIDGRGSTAFQYVTAGTTWPQFPVRLALDADKRK